MPQSLRCLILYISVAMALSLMLNPLVTLSLTLGVIASMALTRGILYLSRVLSGDIITSRPIRFSIVKQDFFSDLGFSPIGSPCETHCIFKDESGDISWYVNGVKRDTGEIL